MKAVITKSQYNRIKNFINETKEIKKDEVLDEKRKKKLSKKQLDTFDINNDGDIEADDLSDLRNMKKITKEELKGGQKKLDKNRNNKIDADDFKLLRKEKPINEQKRNIKQVVLTLDETGLKHFRTTPTFKDLLNPQQLAELKTGDNKLNVNHYVYSALKRVVGYMRNHMSVSDSLDEGSDCGCGEDKDDTRYMFFSNLEQMIRQAKMLLDMDEDAIEDLLNNGHDWAADHIAEAKNNMDQVFDFIMGEMHGEGESWHNEKEMVYEAEAWASDGGYYNKPERSITISKQEADFINKVISNFKRNINTENAIIVDNSTEGKINNTIINDLRKNWNVKFDYESEEDTDYYYLVPSQNMEDVNDGLEYADQLFYDRIINEGMSLKKKAFVSKELKNHLDKNIPLSESEFKSGSPKHIELLKEVKELYNKGLIELNETDEFIVNEFNPKPIKVKGIGEVYLGLIQEEYESDEQLLSEAVYQGRKVSLGKPFLTPDGPKKRSVYVRNDKGNVVKVNFGDPNMRIKKNIPARRKSFRARHNCANPGPRFKSRYWSCRFW